MLIFLKLIVLNIQLNIGYYNKISWHSIIDNIWLNLITNWYYNRVKVHNLTIKKLRKSNEKSNHSTLQPPSTNFIRNFKITDQGTTGSFPSSLNSFIHVMVLA